MADDAIKQMAREGLDQYRRKRALIAAIEKLDCNEDAALIEAIARAVPNRAPRKRT